MNTWFILAATVSLLYAITNQIDKSILEKYLKIDDGVAVLLLFSCLFAAFGIPYAIIKEPDVLNIKFDNVVIMVAVAALNTTLLYCYLKALDNDDPAVVVLYYQLVPVFTLVIGYFVLGEKIKSSEGWAMAIVIIGTTIAGIRWVNGHLSFRWTTFAMMIIATTCWAAEMTISKIVILEESVYHSIFWEATFMTVVGLTILTTRKVARQQFIKVWRVNTKPILVLMLFGELVYTAGNTMSAHASELKEVALVMLSQPLQTIFVFVLGIMLSFLLPNIYKKADAIEIIQMVVAITITGVGTYLLFI